MGNSQSQFLKPVGRSSKQALVRKPLPPVPTLQSQSLKEWPATTAPEQEAEYAELEVQAVVPAAATPAAADFSDNTPSSTVFPTFVEALELDSDYEKEFSSGNFLYLRSRRDLMNCTAYDLEVCEHFEINAENYYTMSASGITHFLKSDPDFTFISDWEREFRLYNMIRQIPFFKKYRVWKSFMELKRIVRSKKTNAASDALTKELFLFSPALRVALLKIKSLCYDVGALRLIDVDPEDTYELLPFSQKQEDHQVHMATALRDFSDNIRQLVKLACDEVIDGFLHENNIVADIKMTFMERASLRTECRKLTKFLRLTDFLMNDCLRNLALDSYDSILEFVKPTVARDMVVHVNEDVDPKLTEAAQEQEGAFLPPMFQLEVTFGDGGDIALTPNHRAFKETMSKVIADSINVISIPEQVLGHEELSAYTMADADDMDDTNEENLTLEAGILKDDHYIRTTKLIFTGLDDALDQVLEYTEVFVPFKETFFENSGYMEEMEELYRNVDLEEYGKQIEKYKGQSGHFQNIPYSADVGIVRCDSIMLKERLMPSPVQCLRSLKKMLPELMRVDNLALIAAFSDLLPTATSSPSTVDAFVAKTSMCQQAALDLQSYKDRAAKVGHMEELMDLQEWSVPDDEKANKRMVAEDLATLENAIEVAAGSLEEDTKKFAEDVDKEIKVVEQGVQAVREQLDHSLIADVNAKEGDVINFLEKTQKEMSRLKEESDKLARYQVVLKQPVAEYETLHEAQNDQNLKYKLWTGVRDFSKITADWVNMPFESVDANAMEKTVQDYFKVGFQASKGLPGNMVGPKLKQQVEDYKPLLPIIVDLRNDALKDRHWDSIHAAIGFQMRGVEGFTLGTLIERHVGDHAEEISQISVAAVQEKVLEDMLSKVRNMWVNCDIELNPYKEAKDMWVVGSTEEITTNLDDCLVTINTILGSRFVGPIRDEVEKWQHRLVLFQDTMDEWLMVQRNWMYLETIFSAPDIQRQLPEAAKMFFICDKSFREIMFRTNDNPNALRAATIPGLKDTFASHNATLDKIQKNLEDYLETKRMAFPRFYFLSNDELLEILAQTKNVQAVQPHLRKCFDNLVKLDFGPDPKSIDIFAMFSGENERVPLGKNLKARGNVEDWLTAVEKNMKSSLHRLMKAGLLDYDTRERKEWIFQHAGQCVASVAQMVWARETEHALEHEDSDKAMGIWYQQNLDDLQDLIVLIRSDLRSLDRKIVVALVTTDVHARDIVQELYDGKVDTINNFEWLKCLRYYWDEEADDLLIHHSDAIIDYGYEYMGACSRLVITPLTDRCWMTITGSYGLKLGAAPAGPAGTGKTESSKDLAKAMAILCVVFNCSDQIDYKFMGKMFRGLAQMGGWVCLDEFNRIDIEVLSVVAQQMLTLREGRLAHKSHINFMGIEIRLMDHHVIITMNPGYAGRTELPDNLQVCFRPVSMMVPDYGLIAEIMLFAEGFGDAKALSRKMCKLYILCSEQLSQQPHYDYGLRAVKSVLVMAGGLKRGFPDLSEDLVLIRALRDSNKPKFLSFDLPLFDAIVGDLFPGAVIPPNDYGEFGVAMLTLIEEQGLQPNEKWMDKIREVYDISQIRFGMCIVGPTGAGKSANWNTLRKMMCRLREEGSTNQAFQMTTAEILNPKCITMGELYGEFNEMTQEWHDGLAPTIMRRAVSSDTIDKKWCVFDGPIDALWIENMNTVLDDNMTLCLANGERIKLKVEMKMLFEVMDLAVASPATVSRIGIVYMTPEDLGWMPYVVSWIPREMSHCTPACQKELADLFEKFFAPCLKFLAKHCKEPIATVPVQKATGMCFLMQSMFTKEKVSSKSEDIQLALLRKVFVFSLVWSIGASISGSDWEKFDEFFREFMSENGLNSGMSNSGMLYDYWVDFEEVEFQNWAKIVPEFKYDPTMPYSLIMVDTVDTVRFAAVTTTLLSVSKPVFFTGITGTGKTVVANHLLHALEPSHEDGGQNVLPVFVSFSAQTSSLVVQSSIEAKLEKKRKTLLGAPAGKTCIVFVDDVNMPFVEEYGAQAPIELLRQFLDFKGFYDRDKLFWKDIESTVLTCGAAPPGGGRNEVTPRFVRHFNVLCMQKATDQSLGKIFTSILGGFFQQGKFADEIFKSTEMVVKATVEIYNRISAELLPTPARFHYTFNLRDISKVFQGMMMVKSSKCQSPAALTSLWNHELSRVFYDRLINVADQDWFKDILVECLGRFFRQSTTVEDLFGDETKTILWVDFMKPGTEMADRTYEEAKDLVKVQSLMEDYLEDYNVSNAGQMNLVFFLDALKHCSRVSRLLRQPRGNAMLIGVGGSGKQSLCRLAASVGDMKCIMIELVRGYGINELREDIKLMMINAGVAGKHTVWLFTDTQIVNDSFLEDINNILNAGEVPNLFPEDEISKIVGDMRPVVKAMGLPESKDVCLQTFVNRVRDFLHIVLCMSPVGDNLRVNCRQFPSLINCCTIDWFMPWPKTALVKVAHNFLSPEHLELPDEDIREAIIEMCGEVHTSVASKAEDFWDSMRRRTYTTPKSYLDLISLYMKVLSKNRADVQIVKERMEVGITKLKETNEVVSSLQAELEKLKPVLKQKSEDADILLKQVAIDQAAAAIVKERVEKDAAAVAVQSADVAAVQADAQADLDVALPAMNSAIKALDSLSKADITEVKSFAKPPPAVMTVMEAVCILLQVKPDWDSSKKKLGESDFMDQLKLYDKDNISAGTIKKLKKYVDDPAMAVEVVKKVSKAATSLCMWCHAMDVYAAVAKEVGPKREKLAQLNTELNAANTLLAGKQAELQAVVDKVAMLQQQCDATVAEKEELAAAAEQTKNRLIRADKLTLGLSAEGIRWKETLTGLTQTELDVIGASFLSAASVSYIGPFTGEYRNDLVDSWKAKMLELGMPCNADASLVASLGDPVVIRSWQLFGLPTDPVSIDNALMTTTGSRWPLCIDPQAQANAWIRNLEEKQGVQVTTMTDINMLRALENCIRIGKPLLIEDMHEHIDPALEPILQKAVFKQGGRLLIHLGDSDIDYDPGFKLYMTTKMPNPHYLPETCIKVTIINFTVTLSGLQDQLLNLFVKQERPDVDEKKINLMLNMAADKKKLQEIEDNILKLLAESKGNILDDAVLINTLADSKVTGDIIKERVQESEKTNIEIEIARSAYVSAATRTAVIYFVIADLAQIDPMYQYSLEYYNTVVTKCIEDSEKSPDIHTRLETLINYSTKIMYACICRGLFEKDKVLYAALLCVQILRERNEITDQEWKYFLRGSGPVDRDLQMDNPHPKEINEFQWDMVYVFEAELVFLVPDTSEGAEEGATIETHPFEGLQASFSEKWDEWLAWIESDDVVQLDLPCGFEEKCNDMHKLILLKNFREELGKQALNQYVGKHLGPYFASIPTVTMENIYADLDNQTPCVFVLSTGADPTSMLLRFCKTVGYGDRLGVVSLGQGQGDPSEALIKAGAKSGDWVLLQNCMLAKSWMPRLEELCFDLKKNSETNNEAFRLYLTSKPVDYFPVTVLQNGVKMTNEPPTGLRAGVQKNFATFAREDQWETCAKKDAWKKLIFGLIIFGSMVMERRKYGPLGWNIPYGFNETDLETSIENLRRFLDESPIIPWDAMSYVSGQINYGGRVTDDWDRRCLMSILGVVLRPAILDDSYKLSPSGTYFCPPAGPMSDFEKYIETMPAIDQPEIFGMHENADVLYNIGCTRVLVADMLSLQPRDGGGGGGKSSDDIATEIADSIAAQVPSVLDEEDAGPTTFVIQPNGLLNSVATVLSQEMVKFNKLLDLMVSSLKDVVRAIQGLIIMDHDLDDMYTHFLRNAMPPMWLKVSFASLKTLGSWVKDMVFRVAFMKGWIANGEPAAFPLPVFFFPQGFMTGILQTFARKHLVAVNLLSFKFHVTEELCALGDEVETLKDGPDDGCYVYGLMIEGARFDRPNMRVDRSILGEIYTSMPLIHFDPAANHHCDPADYACPVYKTSKRAGILSTTGMSTNFVLAVELPTIVHPDQWVLAGMACLCNLTD
jgi:dynein heavy chain